MVSTSMSDAGGSRVGVWHGPALISVALVVLGLATYGYLTIAARVLDPDQYGQVAAFWSLVFAVIGGAFTPLEVEGTRAVSAQCAVGHPVGHVVRRLAWLAVLLTGVLLAILVAGRGFLADTLFDGNSAYVGLLSAVAVAFAAIYLGRGVFAGHRRFGRYSTLLAGEGLVRLAVAAGLVLLGVVSGPAVAAAVPIGAWLAAAVTLVVMVELVWRRPTRPSVGDAAGTPTPSAPTQGTQGVAANLGSLLVASLASQGLNNAGPLTAQALGDDPALTGGLLAAFILVRVPVMFISALQSGFIPSLVGAVRSGEEAQFHVLLRGVLLRVSGVGAVAVVGAGIAGPFVVRLFFGPDYQLQGVDFAVLTLATVAFVLASILQAALVALDRHRVVAVAWVAGLVLYGLALLLPLPLLRQVELGYLIGTFGVCLLLAAGLELSSESRRRERAVARERTV